MLCIDFGPDFELRMWCRHSTIERSQELARTRRAVDASRDDALTPPRHFLALRARETDVKTHPLV